MMSSSIVPLGIGDFQSNMSCGSQTIQSSLLYQATYDVGYTRF